MNSFNTIIKLNTFLIFTFSHKLNIKYSLIYTGDSSGLLGGCKVEFELSKKISEYVYDCNILKVLNLEEKPKMMIKSYNTNGNKQQ